jgi:hypothetical protein
MGRILLSMLALLFMNFAAHAYWWPCRFGPGSAAIWASLE